MIQFFPLNIAHRHVTKRIAGGASNIKHLRFHQQNGEMCEMLHAGFFILLTLFSIVCR